MLPRYNQKYRSSETQRDALPTLGAWSPRLPAVRLAAFGQLADASPAADGGAGCEPPAANKDLLAPLLDG
jgi:hypothetical protein